ncbi:sensor domain-containing protein [Acinetobacter tianfuensis]|uniref:EAL domain-containing protein n=1 Tax=Acinetobacter tianfuensis TaxID=2419603 RepID=A0A3A8EEL0_9GAMM|nr:GGDEF and EAL domain-containing protein [Acinetobacter tianfuensis]RKG31946.1 EAL domain-containing protein [Acinetobacter tianfuensis]
MDTQLQFSKISQDLENYKIAIDAHSIVAVTDARGVITHVNKKFCDISKYSAKELIGSTHQIINSGCHPKHFFKQMWKTIAQGEIWQGEICNRNKEGELYWVDTTIVPLKDEQGVLRQYFSIRTDISQLKNSEDHARYMALHDELTGLPNRRYMQDRIRHVLAKSRENDTHSAMIMLDLDNFKNINDTLGHEQGDRLLRIVALCLRSCVPQPNSIIRLGGDEFLVILSDLNADLELAKQTVLKVANKITATLNKPFYLNKQQIHTGASSGIFVFKNSDLPEKELLKYADMALYQAKGNGKNCVCVFDPAMEQRILAKAALMTDLRRALQDDEFLLHYQKIVNAEEQTIGYEALVRWLHPEKGLVMPSAFINDVEKSGMIHELGKKVLTMACQQLYEWSKLPEYAQLSISVNISIEQFNKPDFDELIIRLINTFEVNPSLLRLELTESMFYADMHGSIAKMNKLIQRGLKFSMDDFGTGYSSLNYLKILPLSQLKIDRSFVENIVENKRDFAIVQTILNLALILELDVVAEGVETEEQFQLLKDSGCTAFQGYYFGRPQLTV